MQPQSARNNAHTSPSTRPTRPFLAVAVALGVALIALVADQVTKYLVAIHYHPNELIITSPYLSLVYVTNAGGVCGYAQGAGPLLTLIGIVTTLVVIASFFLLMPNTLIHAVAFGLLLAGALGNLIDRLRFGYVIDFISIDLLRWPSFNIADGAILAGIFLIGLLTLGDVFREGKAGSNGMPQPFSRSVIVLLIVIGFLFAAAYYVCIFRPFG